jgi:hypothetical protein
MKSFKIREGSVVIDGIHYQSTPCDTVVKGKMGKIQSINIGNRGQFFPVFGEFSDSDIPVTEDSTGIVEEVAPTKVRKTKSK